MRKIVYLQGGGPTTVINASFLGVLRQAKEEESQLYVSRYGLEGLINDSLEAIDPDKDYGFLEHYPGSYFGSARISLKKNPEYLPKILDTLRKRNIDALLLNGGNDTMDSANRLSLACEEKHVPCHVLGIPKTIDNDLVGTDRCPGFLSAAKALIHMVSSILVDDLSYRKGRVNVIEVMGRDNGSLAASTSIPLFDGIVPDFIYVPEVAFNLDKAIEKAIHTYERKGHCNIVVSEGIHDKDGNPIASVGQKDSFGNVQLGGVSAFLAAKFSAKGIKNRAIELSIPQRAAFYLQSSYDVRDAESCGRKAVLESHGTTGRMIGIVATKDLSFDYRLVPLAEAAGKAVSMSLSYVNAEHDNILPAFGSDFRRLILGE